MSSPLAADTVTFLFTDIEGSTRLLQDLGDFEAIGGALHPSDREILTRRLALARAQLDEASFAGAWAEGQAMTIEEAVQYALDLTDGETVNLYFN